MKTRFLLCVALIAASLATGANAGLRTAAISVSATVIASCRVELPRQVQAAAIPAARLTCPPSSRPALRTVIERGAAAGADFRWVRYDVEY